MRLDDLPTPCLVLDRHVLEKNIRIMADAVGRHGVGMRPHMKTAKSIDVARLAMPGSPAGSPSPPWRKPNISSGTACST